MPRNGAILDLRGPSADHHLLDDEAFVALVDTSTWHPERAPRAQTCDQLTLKRAAALHIQRLVDRLMADPRSAPDSRPSPNADPAAVHDGDRSSAPSARQLAHHARSR